MHTIDTETKNVSNQPLHDIEGIKSMIEVAGECAILVTPKGIILACNEIAAQRHGTTQQKLIGRDIFSFLPPQIAAQRKKEIDRTIRTGSPVSFENHRAGIDFRHSLLPVVSSNGTVKAIAVFAADISKEKKLENRLQETETLFKTILENISDAVFLTDGEGNFRYVCKNVATIFGATRQQVARKKNIHKLIEDIEVTTEELIRKGGIYNRECIITDRSGKKHTLLVNIRHVNQYDGSRVYICRDITDRQKIEDTLYRKNIALTELLNSIEKEKTVIGETIEQKLRKLVYPIIDMIAERPSCSDIATLLKSSLSYATSASPNVHSLLSHNLSPRELQLCTMIQTGLTIKQMAQMLNSSPLTIEKQRKSIRRKLGIADGKTNLVTYLNLINP